MNLKNLNVKEFGINIPPFLALVASNLEMCVFFINFGCEFEKFFEESLYPKYHS
jgi:hypothetical protein